MTLAELLREIERKGKPAAARTYRRHGVTEPTVGLSYADIGALVKRIGVNHGLALALWNTGLHEARIVATKIADPRKLTKTTLRRWMKVCGNYVVTGAVADAAANAPEALGLAREWASSPREWASTAGWTTLAILAMHAGVDEPLGDELIAHDRARHPRGAQPDALCDEQRAHRHRRRHARPASAGARRPPRPSAASRWTTATRTARRRTRAR